MAHDNSIQQFFWFVYLFMYLFAPQTNPQRLVTVWDVSTPVLISLVKIYKNVSHRFSGSISGVGSMGHRTPL